VQGSSLMNTLALEDISRNFQMRRSATSRTQQALADLRHGLSLWRLWIMFGWIDIRQRYRRALIGPFWITISMAVMVTTLGVIYSSLFHLEIHTFIPFLTTGFCAWFVIQASISEATLTFMQAEAVIKNTNLPLSVHVYRLLWRNAIVFAHNVVIMFGIYLFFDLNPGWGLLTLIPGFALLMINLAAFSIVLGMICVRFRDAPPMIGNLLQIIFFVTPILYDPAQLSPRLMPLVDWNPFYHLVLAVRGPLLGRGIPMETIAILLAMAAISWLAAFVLFRRFRSRIAYWL
jgi:lipopolysaccharide transport system permease protein